MSPEFAKTSISIVAVAAVSILSGCFWGEHAPATASASTPPVSITGSTTLGKLGSAKIRAYMVDNQGQNGPQIGDGSTNGDGTFELKLGKMPDQPFRVCATDGNYIDESTGKTLTNQLTALCALVPGGTADVNITPLTGFADGLAKGKLKKKTAPTANDVKDALGQAQQDIQNFFKLTKAPHQIKPVFTPPAAGVPPGDDYKLGALLGAYSQLEADNSARCGDAAAQNRLEALIKDIADGVFDGKTIDPADATKLVAVIVACANAPGGKENLALGAGTAELLAALDKFAKTDFGMNTMHLDQQPALRDDVRTAVATGALAPPQITVVASQGLIAIDTGNKMAYVPVYSFDANGNARIAVVDLINTPTDPTKIPTISLPGSVQPIASSFDSLNHRVYVEARRSDNGINVYQIDPSTRAVLRTIDAKGLTHSGSFGGIIANPAKNKVIVVGTNSLGIIDISVDPPVFVANSVIQLFGTDSIALNFDTQILFNSSDGSNQLIDTSVTPPTTTSFPSGPGTTDGVAFDNLTNVVILDPEFVDETHVFNFGSLTTMGGASDAPRITVPGLGATDVRGEGPGGQAAINVLTHQGIVADEFGENFKLLQLPTATFTGPVNNNGQPGSNTTANASSAFQIAATVIPKATLGGLATQLTVRGDPSSVSIDPVRNFMYALADTATGYNQWPTGDATRPLFLVEEDLSQPVLGASPTTTAVDAQKQPLRWSPASRLIRLP
jgi:hypothetical protein